MLGGDISRRRVGRRSALGLERLELFSARSLFGEMTFLLGASRSASVAAITEAVVPVSTRGQFRQLLRRAPGVAGRIVSTMSERSATNQAAA